MAKKEFYNISKLLSTEAEYLMLLGKRANGKSYQVKTTVLTDAFTKGKKFVYLRRYITDIKTRAVSSYFEDMPIKKLTKGKWQTVEAQFGYIYFMNRDSNGQIKEKEEIGRYCALNEAIRYKSQVFKDYHSIVYEEFITDEMYLSDEPRLLQQFVSTVFRLDKGKVFLVGNTLSRVCPYFNEWCLEGVLNQKQGTIDIYNFHVNADGEESVVRIAVEQCANTKNENTMFFGTASKQILTGEWDVKDVPKLPKKMYQYELVYEVKVLFQAFKFVMQLMVEPREGGKIVYVYPLTTNRSIYRVITDKVSDKPYETNGLNGNIKAEKYMQECIRLGKIFYSDNLTGSDFSKVLNTLKL